MTATAMDEDRLAAYLPRVLLDWTRQTPQARFRTVEGTLVLADVSGFTALTERLARAGQVGAEETSDLLDIVFSDLLQVASRYGGHLVKWGGDAVLLLFRGDGHAAAACRAAWEMRAALRSIKVSATAGPVRLRLSVGVHSGRVDLYLVGASHRELIVTGATAGRVARLQSAARTGEILVGPATARLLGEPGRRRRPVALRGRPAAPEPAKPSPVAAAARVVDAPCLLPSAIRRRLAAGPVDSEHRRVAVGFVEFSGIASVRRTQGRIGVWEALQELIGRAQRACDRSAVTFLETDVSPDGGKILLVAGAPESHDHDGERLIRTLQEIAHHSPLRVRAGANAGRVFAGEFGPPDQRTYSVKGDAVNLAARVMGHARPGQLLATSAVLDPRRDAFHLSTVPPFPVKGKAEPIHAVAVGAPHRPGHGRARDATPLVGRGRELRLLRAMLSAARDGRGQVATVTGPPGIGKSRLVRELAEGEPHTRVVWAACDHARADTPYALFDLIIRDLLAEPDDATIARALDATVRRRAPDLKPWLPLLGAVIRTELPPTPETASLGDEFIGARRELMLTELLTVMLPGPTLLVIDDAQLADAASASALGRLLETTGRRPWLVLLTGAHDERYASAHPRELRLGPLDATDAATLLSAHTRETPLLPHVRAAVAARAAGNPLFLRELIPLAVRSNTDEELPASVEEVLAVEIDRLAPPDRLVLRIAAVGGMHIEPDVLAKALGHPLPAQVWDRLSGLVTHDDEGLSFRHALVRDTAYQGMSYRRRRRLHHALALALQHAGESPETQAELLASHFFHAEDYTAAGHYARIAGERAAAAYANAAAATFFDLGLKAARHRRPPVPEEVARLAEACGDIRCRLGDFDAANAAYRVARNAVRDDPHRRARLDLKTAQVVAHTTGFAHALAWTTRGRHALADLTDADAARQDARLLVQAALVRHLQGRHDITERVCHAAAAVATRAGARDVLAQAWQLLDAADVARGRFDGEPWAQHALAIWRERDDLAWQARARNQIGIRAYFTARWADALLHYRAAADTFRLVGDEWNAAIAACNVGEILADQGHLTEAEGVTRPAAAARRASAAISESSFAQSVLGRIRLRESRISEAKSFLETARAGYLKVGEHGEVLATDLRLTECLLAQRRPVEAMRGRLADDTSGHDTDAAMAWLRGHALAQQGEIARARAAFVAGLDAARSREDRHAELLALDALVRLDRRTGRQPDPRHVAARTALTTRLGVIAVHALPLTA